MVKDNNGFFRKTFAIFMSDLSQRSVYIFLLIPLTLLLLYKERGTVPPAVLSDGISQDFFRLFMGDYRIISEMSYQPPFAWILLNAYIAFIVGGFPFGNMETAIITKFRSRVSWWVSKCFSLLFIIALSHAAIFCTVILTDISELKAAFFGFDKNSLSAILLPFAVSAACSFVQSLMNLYLKPVFGYVLVVSMQIASTFIHSPVLFAGYSQLNRTVLSNPSGITLRLGFTVSVTITLLCAVFGAFMSCCIEILGDRSRK